MEGWLEYSAKRYALLIDTGIFTTRVSAEPNFTVTWVEADRVSVVWPGVTVTSSVVQGVAFGCR